MTGIPDDVIETMVQALCPDPTSLSCPQFDFDASCRCKQVMLRTLRAAEARGYKLIGREPTSKMLKVAYMPGSWPMMWDAAPGVGKP